MAVWITDSLKIFFRGPWYSGRGLPERSEWIQSQPGRDRTAVQVWVFIRQIYLTMNGDQIAQYIPEHFFQNSRSTTYDEDGNWIRIEVEFPGRDPHGQDLEVHVGAVKLYLLDTDDEDKPGI